MNGNFCADIARAVCIYDVRKSLDGLFYGPFVCVWISFRFCGSKSGEGQRRCFVGQMVVISCELK